MKGRRQLLAVKTIAALDAYSKTLALLSDCMSARGEAAAGPYSQAILDVRIGIGKLITEAREAGK